MDAVHVVGYHYNTFQESQQNIVQIALTENIVHFYLANKHTNTWR